MSLCGPSQQTVPSLEGYLSSLTAYNTGIGSHTCPWVLRAHPGQRFQLTLLYFWPRPSGGGTAGEESPGDSADLCYNLGTVKEHHRQHASIMLCGQELDQRTHHIYTSTSHSVQVYLKANSPPPVFLIKYKGQGLPYSLIRHDGHTS